MEMPQRLAGGLGLRDQCAQLQCAWALMGEGGAGGGSLCKLVTSSETALTGSFNP